MINDKQVILVVDDDTELCAYLEQHFEEKRNFEVIFTTSPLHVVDLLQRVKISLMLLDMKMKQMTGIEVLDKIEKSNLSLPPLLVITGQYARFKDKLTEHNINSDDVVEKPFGLDQIQERIDKKLGVQNLPSEVGTTYEEEIYKNNKCHIAIVEDEDIFVNWLVSLFEERNYKVSAYKNGKDAYEGIKANPPHIALIDIKMPGMSGTDIIENLYQMPNAPYFIPVSGENPDVNDLGKRLKDCGCDDFWYKPVEIFELVERVKQVAVEKGLI